MMKDLADSYTNYNGLETAKKSKQSIGNNLFQTSDGKL